MSLSVIIPTFNNVEFLSELFDSIKKSNFDGEYEVLIGIDSCKDTLKYVYENESTCGSNKEKIKIIANILIKLFKKKRHLLREIILLKSAFSIIDQMFHKEIKDAEEKRSKILCCFDNTADYKNPEEMNDFIKNLMDPFNNCIVQSGNDFDTYYEEYYKLYDIEQPSETIEAKTATNSRSFRLPFLST